MMRDRSYIGEIRFRGQWHPGSHEPLVDRPTWNRVQSLLGEATYRTTELTYGGELIECGFCGHPVTGECKSKKTKKGIRDYIYYRCTRYNRDDHPRIRLKEEDVDRQILGLFDQLRIEDENVRDWFARVLREKTRGDQETSREQRGEWQRQLTRVIGQQDQLLNLRLLEEIDADSFAKKQTELRDQAANLRLKIDSLDRQHDENADIAIKAFELSQSLRERWVTADFAAKRRILEILCLNFRLDDVTLVPEWRKPFDVLAKGLDPKNSRAEWI